MHVRPIDPSDADRLVQLHRRLSPSTIRFRFFSARPKLSAAEVARFTVVDHDDRVALVALLNDELIAVARYERLPGTTEAEAAFVVEDVHQGRGLGTILLEHLAAAARERGIRHFVAEVLPDNRKMLSVFHSAGWAVRSQFRAGVVSIEFAIDPTEGAVAAQQEREHRAEARSIARLLHPASVVVVGAGRSPQSFGHAVLRNIVDAGFTGALHVVNAGAAAAEGEVAGVPALASVLDVPGPVDLAVVAAPAEAVPGIVADCGRKGVRGMVIVASGFADTDAEGAAAERHVVAAARASGMRVVGPSSMGVVNTNPEVCLSAVVGGTPVRPGVLGILSQSGALGIGVLEWASRPGLGVSTFVSVGNKADVSGNDLLQYWEDDDRTRVVGLYLESFGNPRKFARLARRVARRKPVLAVKSGRGGGDETVDALFRQAGVLRVDGIERLFDVAALFATQPLPAGRRVAVVASAGGPALLTVDALEAEGLEPVVRRELRSADPDDYGTEVEAVLADPQVDAVLLVFITPLLGNDETAGVANAVAEAAATAGKPVVAVMLGPRPARPVTDERVPTFRSPEAAAVALGLAASYGEWCRRAPGVVPHLEGVEAAVVRDVVDQVLGVAPDGRVLTEPEAAELLAAVGVEVGPAVEAAPSAVEVTVGVRHDPLFGPLVTLAVGGPAAALIADRCARITPLTDVDARELVGSLRTAPLLFDGVDTEPLEALLLRVGRLVEEAPELRELVLDPVRLASGAVVVSGSRAALAPEPPRPDLIRRRLR